MADPGGDGGGDDPSIRPPRDRVLVFVDDLDRPELDEGDRRHLSRSLRLRPGDPLTVGDGAGSWRAARFGPVIEADGPVLHAPAPERQTVVGYAPVKGDRSDLVVQKLTELGIAHVVPLVTERSVVRWDDERAARHRDRHQRIVREAAMQSRNPRPPTVAALTPLADFLAAWPEAAVADPDGSLPPSELVVRSVVAIGPEGGWLPYEVDKLRAAGAAAIHLGPRIQRVEVALAALVGKLF